MSDGIPLFHASHNNLSAVNDVISIVSIGRAAAAMRKQKSLDGVTPINVTPLYLIVAALAPGPRAAVCEREYAGGDVGHDQPVREASSRSSSSSRGWRRRERDRVVHHRQSGPDRYGGIRVPGWRGMDPSSRAASASTSTDSRSSVAEDFAAKAIDYRGLYKNIGA